MPYKNPEQSREWWHKRREELRIIIENAKNRPCTDCLIQYAAPAMQFDHVRGEKKFNISSALAKAKTIKALHEELDKCDVVCANCHAIRTDERLTGSKWHRPWRVGRADECTSLEN